MSLNTSLPQARGKMAHEGRNKHGLALQRHGRFFHRFGHPPAPPLTPSGGTLAAQKQPRLCSGLKPRVPLMLAPATGEGMEPTSKRLDWFYGLAGSVSQSGEGRCGIAEVLEVVFRF